jgi:DNA-binding CsgD family transcriptional regulator
LLERYDDTRRWGTTVIGKVVPMARPTDLDPDIDPPESPVPRIAWRAHLDAVVECYADIRGLSPQQHKLLVLYLEGANDKEIAERCGCSEATVYTHWHRMAKKANGCHKSDVITDFHGFLGGKADRDPDPQ